ncbi:helix-turn-helix domain-containing protein [Frankia sp. CiP3]|uniref:helix-turn-helix domain-containing protein n=1 Tax=Frankia sp. CiP3 TaxID=2880971 RepID=UPI001EF55CCA|nr:helix-turn-helix domain-containing protein [Frankia sp. CiP3]
MRSAAGVGAALAAARGERGMSVAEVSAGTRIRVTLIQQMENEDFTGCGGPVYARGHIRSIARILMLDPEPLIAEYDQTHGRPPEGPVLPPRGFDPLTTKGGPGRQGFRRGPATVISLLSVCLLVGLAILLAPSGSGRSTDVVPGAATTTVTPSLQVGTMPAQPAASTRPPTAPAAGVSVLVAVRGDPSWLEVRDESARVLLQQILQPGDSRTVTAARSMEIKMGNAGAVDVSCNGRNLGPSGSPGQVVTVRLGIGASGDCTVGNPMSR